MAVELTGGAIFPSLAEDSSGPSLNIIKSLYVLACMHC